MLSAGGADVKGVFTDFGRLRGEGSPPRECLSFPSQLVLLAPEGHQLTATEVVPIAEVLAFDLVGLHRATSITLQVAEAAEAAGRPMKMRVRVRGFDEMCRMIGAGLGVGLLPRGCVSPLVRSLGLCVKPLTGMCTDRRLLLVYRHRDSLSPAAQAFDEMARQQLRVAAAAQGRTGAGAGAPRGKGATAGGHHQTLLTS